MAHAKNDIIAGLQQEILALQGQMHSITNGVTIGLPFIERCFPSHAFPTGAIHEFISTSTAQTTAASGFIAGVLSRLLQDQGPVVWVGGDDVFAPGLTHFNIDPAQMIFVSVKRQKDLLWTVEEALKCDRLSAVVAGIKNISLNDSRRLQVAVERSRVTGLMIREAKNHTTMASVARWRITSVPGNKKELPGISFPRWQVELLKARNGRTGQWQVEWHAGHFSMLPAHIVSIPQQEMRNTG